MTILSSHLWMDRIEVERCIIGSLLISPEAMDVAQLLAPEHFSVHYPYREIYRAMLATQPTEGVDFISVVKTLREAGLLDAVGGPAVISASVDDIPSNFDVISASELLIRCARPDEVRH